MANPQQQQDYFRDPFGAASAANPSNGSTTQPYSFDNAAGTPQNQPQSTSGNNPFTDVLNHVSAFNAAMNPTMRARTGVLNPADNPDPSNPFAPTPTPTPPANPTNPVSVPQPVNPPPITADNPPPATTPPPTGSGQQGQGAQPKPANATYSDYAWNTAQNWANAAKAQGHDYGWLLQHPEVIDAYTAFVNADPASRTGIDFVDYAAHMFPQYGNQSLAGRNGFDTFLYSDANKTPRGGSGAGLTNPNQTPPPATTPPPGTTPPPSGTPPPGGTPPGTVPPPGTTPPPNTTPAPPTAGSPPLDIQKLIDLFNANKGGNGPDVESLMNPMFARQRQLLQQQMDAQGALTPGRLQSGGFGANEGQALSDLAGVQSGKLAEGLQAEHLAQMQQNTTLMGLATQAGMQKYTTDINNDLERFKVNTNTDLAKWLDSQDNALKKYGIDTNDVLERYKAGLQRDGIIYDANARIDVARIQAAAAESASVRAHDLGIQGLGVDREKNIGQFILGLLGIGNMDLNTINSILSGIPTGTVVVKP